MRWSLHIVLVVGAVATGSAAAQSTGASSGSADALRSVGLTARAEHRLDDAIGAFERASAIAPSRADIHVDRAVALAWSGRHREALAAYELALSLDPDSLAAACGRARVLGWSGRRREARALLRDVAARHPDVTEPTTTLADLEASSYRRRIARRLYGAVLARAPSEEGARSGLERLGRLQTFRLQGGIDVTHFPSRTSYGGNVGAAVDIRPELRIDASYAASGAAVSVSDPAAVQGRFTQRIDVGVLGRPTSRGTLELRYQAIAASGFVHRLGARGSRRFGAHLVLEGGGWLGRGARGGVDVLADGGAVVAFHDDFVLVHVYATHGAGAPWSTTVAAGGRMAVGRRVGIRATASAGRIPLGRIHGLSARVEIDASRRTRWVAGVDWNGGCLSRVAASVGLEVRR